MADLIQIRRDTQDNWESANPTLALGEIGIITDNNTSESTGSISLKVGDGHSTWGQLPEQVFIGPDTLENISASIAAVQTGSSAELNQVSASLNSRITSVSSSISGTVSGVRSDLTSATSSLSGSIAQVSASQVALSSSFSSSLAGVSSSISGTISSSAAQLDGRIDDVSSSIVQTMKDEYALQDGYYSQMSVGLAENLISPDGVTDTEPYIFRSSAGSTSIGTGYATLQKMEGHTVKFNQKLENGNFSSSSGWSSNTNQFTIDSVTDNVLTGTIKSTDGANVGIVHSFKISNTHRYYVSANVKVNSEQEGSNRIWCYAYGSSSAGTSTHTINITNNEWNRIRTVLTANQTATGTFRLYLDYYGSNPNAHFSIGDTMQFRKISVIDLTDMFGTDAEIAAALGLSSTSDITTNTGIEAFESWLTKTVGYKDYYDYSTGKLVSVNVDGLKTVGYNLYNPATGKAQLPGVTGTADLTNGKYCYQISGTYTGITDADGNTITPNASGFFNVTKPQEITVTGGDATTCVHMTWSGYRNGDTEEYWTETLDLTWIKSLTYTPAGGTETQMFPYGLLSAGSVKDEVTATKAIKRVGAVNMGDLAWEYTNSIFYCSGPSDAVYPSTSVLPNWVVALYRTIKANDYSSQDKAIWNRGFYAIREINVTDANYNSKTTFKTAMNGVMLYYELATPIEIDITPAKNLNYKVDDFGTEEFVSSATSVPQTAAPNHTTHYMDNLRDKLRNIVNNFVAATQEQSFTDLEKAQARCNIGAAATSGEYPNLVAGSATNLEGRGTVPAEYTFRTAGGDADIGSGTAQIDTLKGKTLKWNQLVQNGDFSNGTNNWTNIAGSCTFSLNEDVLEITKSNDSQGGIVYNTAVVANTTHKYYITAIAKASESNVVYIGFLTTSGTEGGNVIVSSASTEFTKISNIVSPVSNTNILSIRDGIASTPIGAKVYVKSLMCIDLTEMFGSGNEPTTPEQFEALYPLDYYAYTSTPVLINNAASGIKTTGFNQWDEEWENGTYNVSTGAKDPNPDKVRSKNYISVISEATYYFKCPVQLNVFLYDANKNFVGSWTTNLDAPYNSQKTIPNGVAYITISTFGSSITTYNNDICINLSDTAKNGTYEPYEKHTFYFDKVLQGEGSLATIKGKLNGEGESVVVFPDGLRKAGNVFDEIKGNVAIKRIGSVDLGELSYSSNATNEFKANIGSIGAKYGINLISPLYDIIVNVPLANMFMFYNNNYFGDGMICFKNTSYSTSSAFKTAMSGVILYYELATPETYILDQTVTGGYQVNALGTERRLPEDTASAVNAPVSYSVIYPIDAVGTITKLPINYISEKSLTNFTTELASKLGTFLSASIAVSSSYDVTNQEYDYSITITPNA